MATFVKKSTTVLMVLSSVMFGSYVYGSVKPISNGSELKVHLVVEVKKGKGCVATTAKTPYPLSASQCKEVLAKRGFHPWVDHRNPMMQVEREAIVPLGTQFVYVSSPKFTGWAIIDKN